MTTNISYSNVYTARLASKKSPYTPLFYLLPFLLSITFQLLWLSTPSLTSSAIVHSSLFIPFLGAWGLQFARQVGGMILAHITTTPMVWWDWSWLWVAACAIDANMPRLFGRFVLHFFSPLMRKILTPDCF